nr:putative ribonuclease H-like domain-containing protein [Tanacetum cinerariifolium]
NKTPYALLTRNIPSVSHSKPFGCHVTILNTSDHLGKFDGKADEGYIVGYSTSNKAYRVYNVPNKRVEESMNLRFLEEKPNVKGLSHEWYFDLDYLTGSLGYKHVSANQPAGTQGATTNYAGTQDADLDSDCDEQVIIVLSYPSHSIQGTQLKDTPVDKVDDSLFQFADEIFQKELARLKNHEHRVNFDVESLSLGIAYKSEDLQTPPRANPVSPPAGKVLVPIGSLPVPSGSILVYAAAAMVPNDDVPVLSSSSTDLMFDGEPTTRFPCLSDLGNHDPSPGIFSSLSYDDEFDTALNNVASFMEVSPVATKIDEEVYVTQPKGFVDPQHPKKVYKIVKALYERHQAPRAWYATLSTFLLKHGYRRGTIDKTLILKKNNKDIILDDNYIYEAPKPKSKNESDSPIDVHLYRSMIGSLMYLTASRPDIMFAVSVCSRHQVTPTTSNLEAVKKIFKCLKGQP